QIQDFLEPSSVNPQTALVLVNAIYFKGIWKTAFKEEHTQEVPFNVTEEESRPVQMMCQNSTFKLARVEEDKIKILELPYASGELSLLVLLPDDISGLAQVWPWQGKQKGYTFSGAWLLSDLLLPLANLSGISSAEGLRVSEAIHEAYVEVTEEGTEEAGSADDIEDIQHSSEFEEFRADHPFLFLVKHNPSNLILFFGRYCSP
ncbi:OVALX protein, partial [Regulus satrapa]|nr:OVALX protein [Regulus satrapa]